MIFVIHEHFARRHHYDLRLEMDGVLKSWAIPKNIPMRKGEKRLAIQTEDHDIEYADFEGEIPKGFYGAGIVKIFDKGEYKLLERSNEKIIFFLKGKKIFGKYALIKIKNPREKRKKTENTWIIIKL